MPAEFTVDQAEYGITFLYFIGCGVRFDYFLYVGDGHKWDSNNPCRLPGQGIRFQFFYGDNNVLTGQNLVDSPDMQVNPSKYSQKPLKILIGNLPFLFKEVYKRFILLNNMGVTQDVPPHILFHDVGFI
ncbi:MAG: hypothetical protein CL941_06470 [Desulfobacter sp.]|nr:hypothetical protein [Desulfobacter sp.]MAF33583.1 hypothetical protein [Desulfobacter sp.]